MPTVRHPVTHNTFTQSDTHTCSHHTTARLAYPGDQGRVISMRGQSEVRWGHVGALAGPRWVPHTHTHQVGLGLPTAGSIPGGLVSPGLTLLVWLTAHCPRPQGESDASRADLWAR